MNDISVKLVDSPKTVPGDVQAVPPVEEGSGDVDPLAIDLQEVKVEKVDAPEEASEVAAEPVEQDCDENAKEKVETEITVDNGRTLDLQSERIKEELLKDDNSSIDSTLDSEPTTDSNVGAEVPMEIAHAEPSLERIEVSPESPGKLEIVEESSNQSQLEEESLERPPKTQEVNVVPKTIVQEDKAEEKTIEFEPKVTIPETQAVKQNEINNIKLVVEEKKTVAKVPEPVLEKQEEKCPEVVKEADVEMKEVPKPETNNIPKDYTKVETHPEMAKPDVLPVNGDIAKDEQPIKRRASEEVEESPLKKLCQEVEKTFPKHDSMINDYIQTATKNNVDEIQRHTEQLLSEIQTLRELAQKKEHEWNNILHLKKVKEEILLRLLRRKQVISFEKSSEVNNGNCKDPFDYLNASKNLAIDKSDEISGLALKPPATSINQPIIQPPIMPPTSHFNMSGLPPPYDKAAHMNMPKVFPQQLMMPGPTMPFPRDMNMNGQLNSFGLPMGRQGPTKDVKSIIADYRQRNPDVTPRRGRRMKSILNPNMMNAPRQALPKVENLNLGMIFNNLDMNQKAMLERLSQMQGASLPNGMSFKDVLVQFANIQQQNPGLIPPRPDMMPHRPEPPARPERRRAERPSQEIREEVHMPTKQSERERLASSSPRLPPPPYPEISLLPVNSSQEGGNSQQNSLLHGILTKNCGEITITPVQPSAAEAEKPEEVVQLDDEEATSRSAASSPSARGASPPRTRPSARGVGGETRSLCVRAAGTSGTARGTVRWLRGTITLKCAPGKPETLNILRLLVET
ncbi:unnamed protein product [Plutella xylostella]|uniref:(diamondback moth) hypothetical protein n=1 Tax=Plutella xylostella TaxID=51655 RepID=A0A8S4DQ03_PLUXY|nr:unnamed protein product [Plutella xylostella]